jgi:hypothetical protein
MPGGNRGPSREKRERGGRRPRDDAQQQPLAPTDHTPHEVPATEPTLKELLTRSDALRRTAEVLTRRMEMLAAQIDTAMGKRDPKEPP